MTDIQHRYQLFRHTGNAFQHAQPLARPNLDAIYIFTLGKSPVWLQILSDLLRNVPIYLLDSNHNETPDFAESLDWRSLAESLSVQPPPLPSFGPTRPGWDLGMKRTAALRHARAMHYERILFSDDDIVLLNYAPLASISQALDKFPIATAISINQADRSGFGHLLAVHAYPRAVMPSASFMGLSTNDICPIFPNNYNEDWFFFLLNRSNPPFIASSVFQRGTEMFTIDELHWQEPYDLMAEAAVEQVFLGKENTLFELDFWRQKISSRLEVIDNLTSRSRAANSAPATHQALNKMTDVLQNIDPLDCRRYFSWLFGVAKASGWKPSAPGQRDSAR